jgi:hypothetical protein
MIGSMRPRELFGVGVRILAVWFWTQAAYLGYLAAVKSSGTGFGHPTVPPRSDLALMIFNALVGIALMAGARAFVWLAYGDAPEAEVAEPPDSDNL